MNEEIIKAIRKQILMGGKETLVDAIYLIFENHQEDLLRKIEGMLSYTDKDGKVWIYKDQLKQLLK